MYNQEIFSSREQFDFYLLQQKLNSKTKDTSIDGSSNMKDYGITKSQFLDMSLNSLSKSFYSIRRAKLISDKSQISLRNLVIQKNQRDYYSMYNRVNSLLEINKEENLIPIFITITSDLHHLFSNIAQKDFKKALDFSKKTKNCNDLIFRDILKTNIKVAGKTTSAFKKEDYTYIKSTEIHKSGMFHTHTCFFIKPSKLEFFLKKLIHFYDTKKTNYRIGRTEICLDENNFNYLPSLFQYNRKTKTYTKDSTKNGSYLYFKKLKKDKEKNSYGVVSYVVKYALKTLKYKKGLSYTEDDITELKKNKSLLFDISVFRYTKLRRVSFSKKLLSRYIYDSFANEKDEYIFNKYTYCDLYNKNIKIIKEIDFKKTDNFSSQLFVYLNYNFSCELSFKDYALKNKTSKSFANYQESSSQLFDIKVANFNENIYIYNKKFIEFILENKSVFKSYFKNQELDFNSIFDSYLLTYNLDNSISLIEYLSSFLKESFKFNINDSSFVFYSINSVQIEDEIFKLKEKKEFYNLVF